MFVIILLLLIFARLRVLVESIGQFLIRRRRQGMLCGHEDFSTHASLPYYWHYSSLHVVMLSSEYLKCW